MSVAATIAPSSPYKGLAAFDDTELDALLFFGRTRETEVVAANVLASRLTVLYGPSGVGKSSLLRAGVVRALRRDGGFPPPAVAVYGSWAGDPLAGLEEAARAAVAEALGREPSDAPGSLTDRLAAWSAELGAEVCLLLDQLEELFLYHPAAEGAGGFVELLPDLVARPGLHVNVLLGIRDDALAQLDVFKRRIPGLFANSLRLDHLDREAARAAILGPLERYEQIAEEPVGIEPALVAAVLDEVETGRIEPALTGRGGVEAERPRDGLVETPYLQLVMQRIWEVERERGSQLLRLETFRGLGGAQRIVEDHLERALRALTPGQQDAAADVFGHLVTPSGTKIAHGVTDLATYAAIGERELEPVLISLARERILRPLGENGHAAGGRYEIFHDVLAGAVLAWRTRHDADAALVRERETARRRHRRLLVLTVAALLALTAMTALTAYAFSQRTEANQQASRANEQAELAADRQAQAQELAVAAADSERKAEDQAEKAAKEETKAVQAAQTAEEERQRADGEAAAAEAAEADAKEQAARAETNEALATAGKEAAQRARDQARSSARDAQRARKRAVSQAAVAKLERRKAEAEKAVAEARGLAQQAFALLTVDPERSLDLALKAAKRVGDGLIEDSLRQALMASRVRVVLPAGARVRTAAFSPDGRRVVTASDDGKARIFQVSGDRRRLLHELAHRASVVSASFDPTGTLVVTAGFDRTAGIWSASTGKLEHTLQHAGALYSASFSADGRFVVTASADRTARIWSRSGDPVRTLPLNGSARSASFSPDGSLIGVVVEAPAPDGRRTARVFEAASGTPLYVADQRGIASLTFSPDSNVLATASSDRTTRLWNARSGKLLHELRQPEGRIVDAEFSRDGRLIATSSQGGIAAIWDVATGARVNTLCCPDNFVQSASFSPDGRFVVVASLDRTARIYETVNGRQTMLLAGHEDSVLGAKFSPDGQRVVTSSADGTARVWDPGTADQFELLGRHDGPVRAAVFSRDGKLVLSAGDDGSARLWPARGGPEVHALRHGRPVTDAVFSPEGSLVATAAPLDGTVRVWRVSDGTELLRIRGNRPERVRFSPDSRFLLITEVTGGARVYRLSDRSEIATLNNDRRLTAASFSPDGRFVVGGRADGFAGVWATSTGDLRHILPGHTGRITAASFAPGGTRVVTASEDGTARLWDARTGQQEHVLTGHEAQLTDARFDPAGKRVITASRDNDVRLWSVGNGKLIRTLRAHFGAVVAASFSSDGRWIVTAGPTTAGLWLARTGRLLAFLRGPSSTLTSASFAPRSHRIVASSVDGTVRVYRCDVCGDLGELKALARLRLDRAHGR